MEPKEELICVPGVKPVLECLRQEPQRVDTVVIREGRKGKDVSQIIDACKKAGIRYQVVPKVKLDKIHAGENQGVVARLFQSGFMDFTELLDQAAYAPLPLILALDQVQDTGNVGALARSAYGLGCAGMVVTKHNSAHLGGGAVRASAGTLLRLPVAKVTNMAQFLDKADKMGFKIYGAGLGNESISLYKIQPIFPAILVLGNEEKGIRSGVAGRCHEMITIPLLRDLDSLNVAQAGAMIMSWFGNASAKG